MQQDSAQAAEHITKKLPRKVVVFAIATALAALVQIAGLNQPHEFPLPPSIDCESILTQTTLDNGASLIVDSRGKRMLFTDTQGRLIKEITATSSTNAINYVLEVSAQGDRYYVHGVNAINQGNYFSLEAIYTYDEEGNFLEEVYHKDFGEDEYVSSVDFLYTNPQLEYFASAQMTIHLDFSPLFFLENLVYALSCLWLGIAIVVVVVHLLRHRLSAKGKAILLALFCVLITVCYFTVSNCQQISKDFENNIKVVLNQLDGVLQSSVGIETFEYISTVGVEDYCSDAENREELDALNQAVSAVCQAYGTEQSIYISVSSIQKNGEIYFLANSMNPDYVGQKAVLSDQAYEQIVNGVSGTVYTLENSIVNEVYGSQLLYNDQGEVIAAIFVSSNIDNILLTQFKYSFDLLVNLLAILIGVFVAISAVVMCKNSYQRYRSNKHADASERIANLSGVYMMVFKFAYSVDLVLVVYIAASMCAGMDSAMQAVFVAIPLATYYAGQWIGTFVATPLMRALGERSLALITSVASAGIMLFTAWTVMMGDIVLYSIARGLMGACISGILYVISGTLPLCAKTDKTKKSAIESSMYGSTAAAILTALMGGYVSQFAGYFFIYIIGAGICGVIFLMTVVIFGKKKSLSELGGESGSAGAESAQGAGVQGAAGQNAGAESAQGAAAQSAGVDAESAQGVAAQSAGVDAESARGERAAGERAAGGGASGENARTKSAPEANKPSYRETWSVFLKPAFVAYLVFFSLPNMLTTGYATYLFPLYSNGAGVSALLLSNISVFTLAAMYVCQKPIDRFARQFKPATMLVVPSLVICAGLVCFAVTSSVRWAIIMMFVVSIFNYMTRVSDTTYVFQTAESYGQKPTLVQSNLYTVEATMQIAQSPILSAFASLGTGIACVALGIMCGVMYAIFGLFNRIRPKTRR